MLSPKQCATLILESDYVVILTGAGISTTAGIPDFRGPNGLYVTRKYDPDKIFNINYFLRDPGEFYKFSRDFLSVIHDLKPTFTHRFFAGLQASGKVKCTITQNIDMLHQKAGADKVLELHGSYWKGHCLKTGREYPFKEMEAMIMESEIPYSREGGLIKPDIVFFGEQVKELEKARRIVGSCDLLFVLGSSLAVYPAADLPLHAKGKTVVVNTGMVNLAPSPDRYLVNEELDPYFEKVDACLKVS